MKQPSMYVGIDIASASFTSAVGQMGEGWQGLGRPTRFPNDWDGFAQYQAWLQGLGVTPANSVVCLEATGVYGEALAHYLVAQGYRVAVEPPLKVKRAFKPAGHKSDPVDAGQIAQYAYRFWDELQVWAPRESLLEQLRTLLTTREQFVAEKTGHTNALKALQRKAVRTPLAEQRHTQALVELKGHIQALEEAIRRLLDQDPDLRHWLSLLLTIPGVGLLLAAHMLVIFQAAPQPGNPKSLAAFIGICPYEHTSGSSLHRPATSRHYGPAAVRKLLFLAAMSIGTHNPHFHTYFLRKVQEGKPKQLVINNIANKLLKVMVAVRRSQTPFNPDYQPVHPSSLSLALTGS